MKIVYCISSLYNSAGMERIITEKANAFSEKGHSVYIITTEQKNRKPFYKLHKNIRVIDLGINYKDNNSIFGKLLNYRRKISKHKKSLSDILFEIRPDVTISTMGNEFLFLYKINDGSKKILEIHFAKNYRMMYKRGGLWKLFDCIRSCQETYLAKKYDRFIVLTHEDKNNWGNMDNIEVIPNFITITEEYECIEKRPHILLAIGRLTYQKGFDRLIKACSLISNNLEDWQIHIYGDGELKNELQKMIDGYKLNNYIKLFPATTDIDSVYKQVAGFVSSSRFEGLPMVMIEALSHSLPVISFDCTCGPKDIINNGINGILVKNNDIKELSSTIFKYMNDSELRDKLSQEAYKSAYGFEKNSVINKWLDLFEKVINT